MIGYSEILQTMAAMVLFSLILLTSNRVIFLNSQKEVESEAEEKAVTIAQNYIDEARILAFDENAIAAPPAAIPSNFSTTGLESSEYSRASFDDFDDYHNWSETVDWVPGSGDSAFQVNIKVLYVTAPHYDMANGSASSKSEFKKMAVTVTSDYLRDGNGNNIQITLPYLRKYYPN